MKDWLIVIGTWIGCGVLWYISSFFIHEYATVWGIWWIWWMITDVAVGIATYAIIGMTFL